jgi:hypothetical protein
MSAHSAGSASLHGIKVFLVLFLQKKNRKKDSSFSEEKEAKRLFSHAALPE